MAPARPARVAAIIVGMDLGLHGSRALITGGSRGIGFAVAQALAADGAAVGLIARDADGLTRAAQDLGRQGASVATAWRTSRTRPC